MQKRETYYRDSRRQIDTVRDDEMPAKSRWIALLIDPATNKVLALETASTRRAALCGLPK